MAESQHGIYITNKDGDVHKIPSVMEVQAGLNLRQRTLSAGSGIAINGTTISATYAYDDEDLRELIETETQERKQADAELLSGISALQGAIIYIGVINSSREQIEANASLLDAFVSSTTGKAKKLGYCVIDQDNNAWVWNNSAWVNIGYTEVTLATDSMAGIVKGNSSDDGKVSVDANGEMSVNGWGNLKDNNVVESQHVFS